MNQPMSNQQATSWRNALIDQTVDNERLTITKAERLEQKEKKQKKMMMMMTPVQLFN